MLSGSLCARRANGCSSAEPSPGSVGERRGVTVPPLRPLLLRRRGCAGLLPLASGAQMLLVLNSKPSSSEVGGMPGAGSLLKVKVPPPLPVLNGLVGLALSVGRRLLGYGSEPRPPL